MTLKLLSQPNAAVISPYHLNVISPYHLNVTHGSSSDLQAQSSDHEEDIPSNPADPNGPHLFDTPWSSLSSGPQAVTLSSEEDRKDIPSSPADPNGPHLIDTHFSSLGSGPLAVTLSSEEDRKDIPFTPDPIEEVGGRGGV